MSVLEKCKCAPNECHCAAHEAGREVRKVIDRATHDARDVIAVTEKEMRQSPLKAGAIAAGLGFVVGALFRRT